VATGGGGFGVQVSGRDRNLPLLLRKSAESGTTSSTDVKCDRVRNRISQVCINQRGIGWSNGLCVELSAISERNLPAGFC
jgi:hypothetical protein